MNTENQNDMWIIDKEEPGDAADIWEVNRAAFDRPGEADVVDRLRETCPDYYALVARMGSRIAGHILFTPVKMIPREGATVRGMGLAPLAVHPDFQGRGIGSALCREGLRRMEAAGWPFVIVLGHPGYYPRFGFEPADRYGITCPYEDVPPEAFMIRIFSPDALASVSNAETTATAHYRPEFDEVT
jgi:putative acetyltransferase